MEEFINSLYCWVRPVADKEAILNKKLENQLSCAGCCGCVDNIGDFIKMAKIGQRQYGFCCEYCYCDWMQNPSGQTISPINERLLRAYFHDNPPQKQPEPLILDK